MPGCETIGDVPSLGCLADIIIKIINLAFGFLGFVTLVFIIWGAIKYIIARGDQKGVQGAKNTITYALIGAALVLGSYIIINIVFVQVLGLPDPVSGFKIYWTP